MLTTHIVSVSRFVSTLSLLELPSKIFNILTKLHFLHYYPFGMPLSLLLVISFAYRITSCLSGEPEKYLNTYIAVKLQN
jgi:hypothetical protein